MLSNKLKMKFFHNSICLICILTIAVDSFSHLTQFTTLDPGDS